MNPAAPLLLLFRSRWNLLRTAVAATLLCIAVADTAPRLARLQLASFQLADFAAQAAELRAAGRYTEAIMVADAGLASLPPPHPAHPDSPASRLLQERTLAAEEQSGLLRRATDFGLGALSGHGGNAASTEALLGAVTADLFVVGDLRDLLLQSARLAIDGETDEVILALSAAGLATTLAPQFDWVPALLKLARKSAALSKPVADFILSSVRTRNFDALRPFLADVGIIARRTSPASTIRILRHTDSPADAARLARFLERNATPPAAFALHSAGRDATPFLKAAESLGTPARLADATLITAAAKGTRGIAFLRTPAARALLKPHPLIGIAKSLYKGNAQDLVSRALLALDAHALWLIPALAAWTFLELALLLRRFAGLIARPAPLPAHRTA